jgi:hypothetical protein
MTRDHLSDEQIQAYLDGQTSIDITKIEEHLKFCQACQKNLGLYREVYTSLETDHLPVLPKNFSKGVVLAVSGKSERLWQKLESGFILSFFLISIALCIYFLNPLPQILEAGSSIIRLGGGFLNDIIALFNGNISLMIIALVILFLIEVLDRRLLKSKL